MRELPGGRTAALARVERAAREGRELRCFEVDRPCRAVVEAAGVALAVVGVAGPTTQGDRAVGTVCVAVALPDGATHARTVILPALDRTDVQQRAASVALDFLRRRLAEVAAD